jgi:hypothetical protein
VRSAPWWSNCRLPPGTLPTLYQNDDRFVESYLEEFPGYYKTADAGYIDEDGYAYVMARTDDIINVAGHRLSTGAMEEVLADHPDVAECAVLGVEDKLKGQIPIGFLVLNAGVDRDHTEIQQEVVQMVRDRIGPVAAFKTATVVNRLPKTRSGKILRGTIQKIADNKAYKVPATIDDPTILGEMEAALNGIGLAGARNLGNIGDFAFQAVVVQQLHDFLNSRSRLDVYLDGFRRPLQGKCMLIQNADGTVAIVNPEPEYGEIFHVKGGQLPEAVQCHRAVMFPDDGVVCHDDSPPSTRSVV